MRAPGLNWVKSSDTPVLEAHLVVENMELHLQSLSHSAPANKRWPPTQGLPPALAWSFRPFKPCSLAHHIVGADLTMQTILQNLIPAFLHILRLCKAVSSTGPGTSAWLLKPSGYFQGKPPTLSTVLGCICYKVLATLGGGHCAVNFYSLYKEPA